MIEPRLIDCLENKLKSDFGHKKMAKMSWISRIFKNISGPGPKSGTMDNIHELDHSTCGYIHVLEVHIYVYACKPKVLADPEPFKGKSGDIERFLADCQMNFEVFGQYFALNQFKIVFATSCFMGRACD